MIKEISIVQQDIRHGIYAVDVRDEEDNIYRLCFSLPMDATLDEFNQAIAESYLEERKGYQYSLFTPEVSRVNEHLLTLEKERFAMLNSMTPPRSIFSGRPEVIQTPLSNDPVPEAGNAGQE